jgi:excisionase family DNA binding protein
MIPVDQPDDHGPVASVWLAPREAAAYLGISLGTLRNWTSARYVPFARRGRVVRYRRHDLDAWLMRDACPGRSTLADVRSRSKDQNCGEA